MGRGVMIVGTDTEVGKTMASAALACGLKSLGLDVGYVKPVGTEGVRVGDRLVNPDALYLAKVAGLSDQPATLNPFCLKTPLSPLAASLREGVAIDLEAVVEATRRSLEHHAFSLVEGAGGILVPLNETATFLDLAAALGLPALVVGRAALGTINHTLLTIRALESAGVEVAGFIFCGPPPELAGDPSLPDNPRITARFSGRPHLGNLHWLGSDPSPAELRDCALAHLDLAKIKALAEA